VRTGQHYSSLCPAGMFKGKDTYIFIFAWLDHHWVKLCEMMGRSELGQDPRFVSNDARLANIKEVIAAIEEWLARMPSDDATVEALRAARIPSAPVLSLEQAMAHPHLRERKTVRKIHDRIMGDFEVPGFPLRFSEFPELLDLEAPLLGEHNGRVLSNYLGYAPGDIDRLERDGVLISQPR
jgi:crotonobetainyl-CoA:carnitine CoA-transferase CaiB-like acyl-CoA transferase